VPSDREVVGKILREMVRKKLHSHLIKGDLPSYRFLLNQQSFSFSMVSSEFLNMTRQDGHRFAMQPWEEIPK